MGKVNTADFDRLDRWYDLDKPVREALLGQAIKGEQGEDEPRYRGRRWKYNHWGHRGFRDRGFRTVKRMNGTTEFADKGTGYVFAKERRNLRGELVYSRMFGMPTWSDQSMVSKAWGLSQRNRFAVDQSGADRDESVIPTEVNRETREAYGRIRSLEYAGQSYQDDEDARWFASLTPRQRNDFNKMPKERRNYILSLPPGDRLKPGREKPVLTDEQRRWYDGKLTPRQQQQFDWLPVRRQKDILSMPEDRRLKPGRAQR